jgi:hypothetical protein
VVADPSSSPVMRLQAGCLVQHAVLLLVVLLWLMAIILLQLMFTPRGSSEQACLLPAPPRSHHAAHSCPTYTAPILSPPPTLTCHHRAPELLVLAGACIHPLLHGFINCHEQGGGGRHPSQVTPHPSIQPLAAARL